VLDRDEHRAVTQPAGAHLPTGHRGDHPILLVDDVDQLVAGGHQQTRTRSRVINHTLINHTHILHTLIHHTHSMRT